MLSVYSFVRYGVSVCLCALAVSFSQAAFTQTGSIEISGQLEWPAGFTPTGDAEIQLRLDDIMMGASSPAPQTVTLTASGAESFSFNVDSFNDSTWRLQYECLTGCGGIYNTAYHGSSGTVVDFWEFGAQLQGNQNHAGLSFPLLEGKTVSGEIYLPAGDIPVGETYVDLYFYDPNMGGGSYDQVTIPTTPVGGEYKIGYKISVPASSAGSDWILEAHCNSAPGCDPYLRYHYYADFGTTEAIDAATRLGFGTGTEITGIDITLMKADFVRGEIRLPSPAVASDYISLTVVAEQTVGGNVWTEDYIGIQSGDSATD